MAIDPSRLDWRQLLAETLRPTRRGVSLPPDIFGPSPTEQILSAAGRQGSPLAQPLSRAESRPGLGSQIAQGVVQQAVGQQLEPVLDPQGYQFKQQQRALAIQRNIETQRQLAEEVAEDRRTQEMAAALDPLASPAVMKNYLRKYHPAFEPQFAEWYTQLRQAFPYDPEMARKALEDTVKKGIALYGTTQEATFLGGAATEGTASAVALQGLAPGGGVAGAGGIGARASAAATGLEQLPGAGGVSERYVPGAAPGPLVGGAGPTPGPGPAIPTDEATAELQRKVADYQATLGLLEQQTTMLGQGQPADVLNTLRTASRQRNAVANIFGESHPNIQAGRAKEAQAALVAMQGEFDILGRAHQAGQWDIAVPALSNAREYYSYVKDFLAPEEQVKVERALARMTEAQKELWVNVGPISARLGREGDAERVVSATMTGVMMSVLTPVALRLAGAGIGAAVGALGFGVGAGPGALAGMAIGTALGTALGRGLPIATGVGTAATQLLFPETEEALRNISMFAILKQPAIIPFVTTGPWTLGALAHGYRSLRSEVTGQEDPLQLQQEPDEAAKDYAWRIMNSWHEEPLPVWWKLPPELLAGGIWWHGLKIPFTQIGPPVLKAGLRGTPPVRALYAGAKRAEEAIAERLATRSLGAGERVREDEGVVRNEMQRMMRDINVVGAQRRAAEERGEPVDEFAAREAELLRDIEDVVGRYEMRGRVMMSPLPDHIRDHLTTRFSKEGKDPGFVRRIVDGIVMASVVQGHQSFRATMQRLETYHTNLGQQMATESAAWQAMGRKPKSGLYGVADAVYGEKGDPAAPARDLPTAEQIRRDLPLRRPQDFGIEGLDANLRDFAEAGTLMDKAMRQRIREHYDVAFTMPKKMRGQFYRLNDANVSTFLRSELNLYEAHWLNIRDYLAEYNRRNAERPVSLEQLHDLHQKRMGVTYETWETALRTEKALEARARAEGWSSQVLERERRLANTELFRRLGDTTSDIFDAQIAVIRYGQPPLEPKTEPGKPDFEPVEYPSGAPLGVQTIVPPRILAEEVARAAEEPSINLELLTNVDQMTWLGTPRAAPGPRGYLRREETREIDQPPRVTMGVIYRAEGDPVSPARWTGRRPIPDLNDPKVRGMGFDKFRARYGKVLKDDTGNTIAVAVQMTPLKDTAAYAQLIFDMGGRPVPELAGMFEWQQSALAAIQGGRARLRVIEGRQGVLQVFPPFDRLQQAVQRVQERLDSETSEGKVTGEEHFRRTERLLRDEAAYRQVYEESYTRYKERREREEGEKLEAFEAEERVRQDPALEYGLESLGEFVDVPLWRERYGWSQYGAQSRVTFGVARELGWRPAAGWGEALKVELPDRSVRALSSEAAQQHLLRSAGGNRKQVREFLRAVRTNDEATVLRLYRETEAPGWFKEIFTDDSRVIGERVSEALNQKGGPEFSIDDALVILEDLAQRDVADLQPTLRRTTVERPDIARMRSPWEVLERERDTLRDLVDEYERDPQRRTIDRSAHAAAQTRLLLLERLFRDFGDIPLDAGRIADLLSRETLREEGQGERALRLGKLDPAQAARIGRELQELAEAERPTDLGARRLERQKLVRDNERELLGDGDRIDTVPRTKGTGPLSPEEQRLSLRTDPYHLPPHLEAYESPLGDPAVAFERSGMLPVTSPSLVQVYRGMQPVTPSEVPQWMSTGIAEGRIDPLQAEATTRALRAWGGNEPAFLVGMAGGQGKTFVLAQAMSEALRDPKTRFAVVVEKKGQAPGGEVPKMLGVLNEMLAEAGIEGPIDVGYVRATRKDLRPFEGMQRIKVRRLEDGDAPAAVTIGTPDSFRGDVQQANTTWLNRSITHLIFDEAHKYAKEDSQRGDFVQRRMLKEHGWGDATAKKRAKLLYLSATPFEFIDDMSLYRPLFGMFSEAQWKDFESGLRAGRPRLSGEERGAPFNRTVGHAGQWAMLHDLARRGKTFTMDAVSGEKHNVHFLNVEAPMAERYESFVEAARGIRALGAEVAIGGEVMTPLLNAFERVQANLRWAGAKKIAGAKQIAGAEKIAEDALEEGNQVVFLTRFITSETPEAGYAASVGRRVRAAIEERAGDRAPEMVARLDKLIKQMNEATGELGRSGRDLVMDKWGERVADLTGEQTPAKREKIRQAFQEGRLDVAVVSDASATNMDLHHTKGGRPRVVIPLSIEWTASQYLQKLARTRRYGQLSAPEYHVISLSNVPSEQRFVGGLVNRMKGLGSQVHGTPNLAAMDSLMDLFEYRPDVARVAVFRALRDHLDIAREMYTPRQWDLIESAGSGAKQLHDVQAFLNAALFLPREKAERLFSRVESYLHQFREDTGVMGETSAPLSGADNVRLERAWRTPGGLDTTVRVIKDERGYDHVLLGPEVIREGGLLYNIDLPLAQFWSGWEAGGKDRGQRTYAGIDVAPGRIPALLDYIRPTAPELAAEIANALSPLAKMTIVRNVGDPSRLVLFDHPVLGTVGLATPRGAGMTQVSAQPGLMRLVVNNEALKSPEGRTVIEDMIRRGDAMVAQELGTNHVEFYVPFRSAAGIAEQAPGTRFGSTLEVEPGRRTGLAHRDADGFWRNTLDELSREGARKYGPAEGPPRDAPGVPDDVNRMANEQAKFETYATRATERGQPEDLEAAKFYAGTARMLGQMRARYAESYVKNLPDPLKQALGESWPNVRELVTDRDAMARYFIDEAGLPEGQAVRIADQAAAVATEIVRDIETETAARGEKPGPREAMRQMVAFQQELHDIAARVYGASSFDVLAERQPNMAQKVVGFAHDLVLQMIMRTPGMFLHIAEQQLMLGGVAQYVNPGLMLTRAQRAKLPGVMTGKWRNMPGAEDIAEMFQPLMSLDVRGHTAFDIVSGERYAPRDAIAMSEGALLATAGYVLGKGRQAAEVVMGEAKPVRPEWRASYEAWRQRLSGEDDGRYQARTTLGRLIVQVAKVASFKFVQNAYNTIEERLRTAFVFRWFPVFHERALRQTRYRSAMALWERASNPEGVDAGLLAPRIRNAVRHYLHTVRGPASAARAFEQVRKDFEIREGTPERLILERWQERVIDEVGSADDVTMAQWLQTQQLADRIVAEDMGNAFLMRSNNTALVEWQRRVFPFFNYEVQSPWIWARAFAKNPVLYGIYNGWFMHQEDERRKAVARPERYNGFEMVNTPIAPVAFNPLVGTYPAKLYRYTIAKHSEERVFDPFDEVNATVGGIFVPHPLANWGMNLMLSKVTEREVMAPSSYLAYEPIFAAAISAVTGSESGMPFLSGIEGFLREVSTGYDHNPFFKSEVDRVLASKGIDPFTATKGQRSDAIRETGLWQLARFATGYRVKRYDQLEQKELGSIASDLALEGSAHLSGYYGGPMTVQQLWDAFRRLPQGKKREIIDKHPDFLPYLQASMAFMGPQKRAIKERELRMMAAYEAWRDATRQAKDEVDDTYHILDPQRADVQSWKGAIRAIYSGRNEKMQELRKEILKRYGFSPESFGDMKELERLAFRGLMEGQQVSEEITEPMRTYLNELLARKPELRGAHPWDAAYEDFIKINPDNETYWLDGQGSAIDYDRMFRDRRVLRDTLPPNVLAYIDERRERNQSAGEQRQERIMERYRQALAPMDAGGLGIPRWVGVAKSHERQVMQARIALSAMQRLAGNMVAAGKGQEAAVWYRALAQYQAERIRTLKVDIRSLRRHPFFKRWLGLNDDVARWLYLPENWLEGLAIASVAQAQ